MTSEKSFLRTDESKFELLESKWVFIRKLSDERYSEECLVPAVKYGSGSVSVWNCFGSNHVGDLHKIEGIMSKKLTQTYKNF